MATAAEQRELIARLEQDLSTVQSMQRPDAEVSPPLRPSLAPSCQPREPLPPRSAPKAWGLHPHLLGSLIPPGRPPSAPRGWQEPRGSSGTASPSQTRKCGCPGHTASGCWAGLARESHAAELGHRAPRAPPRRPRRPGLLLRPLGLATWKSVVSAQVWEHCVLLSPQGAAEQGLEKIPEPIKEATALFSGEEGPTPTQGAGAREAGAG